MDPVAAQLASAVGPVEPLDSLGPLGIGCQVQDAAESAYQWTKVESFPGHVGGPAEALEGHGLCHVLQLAACLAELA